MSINLTETLMSTSYEYLRTTGVGGGEIVVSNQEPPLGSRDVRLRSTPATVGFWRPLSEIGPIVRAFCIVAACQWTMHS